MSRFNGQDARRAPRHEIAEVLTCIILGLLAGRKDRKHAIDWCREREGLLRRHMKLAHGVASPSTVCRVLKNIDENDLAEVFIEWASGLVKTTGAFLVVDGKGVRAGTKRSEGERTPYFLNMADAQTQLLVATIPIGSKDNEKVAFHDLLALVSVEGSLVTADAMATDHNIMSDIVGRKGEFIFQVKGNNPEMYQELLEKLGQLREQAGDDGEKVPGNPGYRDAAKSYSHHSTVENNRGRNEYRECWTTNDTDLLTSTQDKHTYIKTIGVIEQIRIEQVKKPGGEDITPDRGTYLREGIPGKPRPKEGDGMNDEIQKVGIISSLVLTAGEALKAKRLYWTIEGPAHYVIDNTFEEDRDTSSVNRARMTLLRRFAYNVMRIFQIREMPKKSTKDVCYYFCDHPDCLLNCVFSGIKSFY